MGIFNSSTVLGRAIAPPALVIMQLAWGWRTMFVVIGLAGIVVGLCAGMWATEIAGTSPCRKGAAVSGQRGGGPPGAGI
ncbi:hypothetical protein LRM35_27415 [Klebsiella variicola subsp. variicola]|nr:hypothetical protein LRM35_27415 [Klebsiella variicola subsp. variicola]